MRKAIYAFSGDPVTYGHLDIIMRAKDAFEELIVAIGNNPAKKYLFSIEERTALVKEAIGAKKGISVTSFKGLLVDFAYEQNVKYIIRGLRNGEDFNFELLLHQVGDSQRLGIETFFLPSQQSLTHISSGAVKALQLEQGLIHEYVPLNVKKALEERLSKQRIIGVTGEIGAGKSHFCREIISLQESFPRQVHYIDLDKVGHAIMEDLQEPVYVSFRTQLAKEIGESILKSDGFIDRKQLGRIVFNDTEKLEILNRLIYMPLMLLLRRKLYGLQGVILLESALLAEAGLTHICNNEVLLLDIDKGTQKRRLLQRGYTEEEAGRRIACQCDYENKKSLINKKITSDGFGRLLSKEDIINLCSH